jgi:hypothetical protein
MQTTFVQAFEDEAAARRALGVMTTAGYKVFYVKNTDQAQLKGYPQQGEAKSLIVGDIDDKKVFVLLSTKDEVEMSEAAAGTKK